MKCFKLFPGIYPRGSGEINKYIQVNVFVALLVNGPETKEIAVSHCEATILG